MRHRDHKPRSPARLGALSMCVLGSLCVAAAASAADVIVPGATDFPESMTASADGTLFFSSMAGGRIFRAAPGQAQASEWIKQGTNGLSSALGILADDKSNTLYACSSNLTGAGITVPGGNTPTALKVFDLKTGAPKASIALPASTLLGQTSLCNDIAVAADGTVYVTDSLAGHVLRLKKGASAFEVWAHDARWDVKGPQLDGIAVLADGSVYANIFEGDGLYRIAVNPDGSAGTITKLQTSRPLFHSDGMRPFGPDKLLMVEGETKGNLDVVTVTGNSAKIDTIKDGFEGPVAAAQVRDVVYVLDVPLKYLFVPSMKSHQPPPFKAVAVKLAQ
jgi:sugar lactone lactonase YvrE